jgi:glucosamine-6-phosphate deaminase
VYVYDSVAALGRAAAEKAAELINEAVSKRGHARVIVATGNSQLSLVESLVRADVTWSAQSRSFIWTNMSACQTIIRPAFGDG